MRLPIASEYISGDTTVQPSGDDGGCNWIAELGPIFTTTDVGHDDGGLDGGAVDERGNSSSGEAKTMAPVALLPLVELAKPLEKVAAGLVKGLILESCLDKEFLVKQFYLN